MKLHWFRTRDNSWRLTVLARNEREARAIAKAHTDGEVTFILANTTDTLTLDTSGIIASLTTEGVDEYYDLPRDDR